jgi:hypothetical protein
VHESGLAKAGQIAAGAICSRFVPVQAPLCKTPVLPQHLPAAGPGPALNKKIQLLSFKKDDRFGQNISP